MRPGGVPAGPGHAHLDLVAGRGDRARAHAELARVEPRVAVQREDPADRRDPARREHVERAAGRLLGGLEDEPDPSGQHARGGLLGQEQAGSEQHGGVHVVAAGMADVRHGRAVRDVLVVRHRQRVEVCPERNDRPFGIRNLLRADVDEQAGSLGQDHRPQARRGQAQRDPAGGAVLVVGQLGMRVQVAAELDQLGFVLRQERVQIREQIIARLNPAMPTIPVSAESVFGELGDEGVYHADQIPGSRVDGSLPFVRGTMLEHFGGHRELVLAA